jgi:hypothetical protein
MRSQQAFATKGAHRNMVGRNRNALAIAAVPTRRRVSTATHGVAMVEEAIRVAAAPTDTGMATRVSMRETGRRNRNHQCVAVRICRRHARRLTILARHTADQSERLRNVRRPNTDTGRSLRAAWARK